jgi:hypothetical protein
MPGWKGGGMNGTVVETITLPVAISELVKLTTRLEKQHGPLDMRQNEAGTRLWFIKGKEGK